MADTDALIAQIHAAFDSNPFPGAPYLQGSVEGDEPFEEVDPFRTRTVWAAVEPAVLDRHAAALSFFSHAGFRFFLPAYLIADVTGALASAQPLFHLTGGFVEVSVTVEVGDRTFRLATGGSTLVNPRRYGALTFLDQARHRLAIFTREEAGAIVAYIEFKRAHDVGGLYAPSIDASLAGFWRERASSAPTAERLRRHLADGDDYVDAVRHRHD
jgi:hypothetical protein